MLSIIFGDPSTAAECCEGASSFWLGFSMNLGRQFPFVKMLNDVFWHPEIPVQAIHFWGSLTGTLAASDYCAFAEQIMEFDKCDPQRLADFIRQCFVTDEGFVDSTWKSAISEFCARGWNGHDHPDRLGLMLAVSDLSDEDFARILADAADIDLKLFASYYGERPERLACDRIGDRFRTLSTEDCPRASSRYNRVIGSSRVCKKGAFIRSCCKRGLPIFRRTWSISEPAFRPWLVARRSITCRTGRKDAHENVPRELRTF